MFCMKCKTELPDGAVYCPACGKKQAQEPRKVRRRPNGAGTVYKLSGRRRKPWVAAKNRIVIGYYETKTAALEALERLPGSSLPQDYNLTFAQAYDRWSDEHFRRIGIKGQEAYSNAFTKYAVAIHERKLRDLRTPDYQSLIDSIMQAGRSRSSAEKLQQLLCQLSKWAVREELTSVDYAQFVVMPKTERKQKEIFSPAELQTLQDNDAIATVRAILIMIYTGVRIGEFTSIRAADVHLSEGYMIGGSKTEAGKNRIIPLPIRIRPYVKELLEDAPPDGRLIEGYSGNHTLENFRKRDYYPALAQLGIRQLTPHATRHTFATLAVKSGVRQENLQKIIGHANFATTAEIYIHQDIATLCAEVANL